MITAKQPKIIRTDRPYTFEKTIETNISQDYLREDGSRWDTWGGIREILQNAIDEATYMAREKGGNLQDYLRLTAGKNMIEVRDFGRGVDFERILLVGESGKRGDQDMIGEKGEGELMSFLVLSQLGVTKWMYSRDWMATARIAPFNGTNYMVLVLDLYRTKSPIKGTMWRVQATDEVRRVYENRHELFPVLNMRQVAKEAKVRRSREMRRRQGEIKANGPKKYTASTKLVFPVRVGKTPKLYIKGVYVRDISALFNYNFKDLRINRDRDMVDAMELRRRVAEALGSEFITPKMAQMYWRAAEEGAVRGHTYLELDSIPVVPKYREAMWRKAFWTVFGKKSCLQTDVHAASDATAEGWRTVLLTGYGISLASQIGISTDRRVSGFGEEGVKVVKPTIREVQILNLCEEIIVELGFKKPQRFTVVGKVLGNKLTDAFVLNGRPYILRKTFGEPLRVLECYLHEVGHLETHTMDFTREFTDWFLTGWVTALAKPNTKVAKLIAELLKK